MSISSVKYTNDDSGEIPVRVVEKPKRQDQPDQSLMNSAREIMAQERFWATLAHAIGPLMIAVFLFGDGLGWLGLMLITAGIYLYYNDKSALVKMHARQALAAQLIGTIGWIALLISGAMVWTVVLIISLVLILALVGLLLAPLVVVSGPLLFLASFILPLGTALFGTLGAWDAWHGRVFRYPYIADKLDKHFGNPLAGDGLIV